MTATQQPAPFKLPLGEMLSEAMMLPVHHAPAVARLSWRWGLVLAGVTGLMYRTLDDAQLLAMQKGDSFGPAGLNLLSLLIGLVVGASVAVGWHRLLLMGEAVHTGSYWRADDTVWRYIAVAGAMLLATLPFLTTVYLLASGAPEAIVAGDPAKVSSEDAFRLGVLMLALMVSLPAAVVLTTRWSLVLPARAIDVTDFGFGDSWKATRGHFWRLFVGSLICYMPALAIGVLAGGLIGSEPSVWRFIAANMIAAFVGLVTSVFPLGFLSLAYKKLVEAA